MCWLSNPSVQDVIEQVESDVELNFSPEDYKYYTCGVQIFKESIEIEVESQGHEIIPTVDPLSCCLDNVVLLKAFDECTPIFKSECKKLINDRWNKEDYVK